MHDVAKLALHVQAAHQTDDSQRTAGLLDRGLAVGSIACQRFLVTLLPLPLEQICHVVVVGNEAAKHAVQ